VVDSGVETKDRVGTWARRPSPPTWNLPEGFRLAVLATNGMIALPDAWPQDGVVAARLNGLWVDIWHPEFQCSAAGHGIHYVSWLRVVEPDEG
jgi:hypothetical protein